MWFKNQKLKWNLEWKNQPKNKFNLNIFGCLYSCSMVYFILILLFFQLEYFSDLKLFLIECIQLISLLPFTFKKQQFHLAMQIIIKIADSQKMFFFSSH